MTPEQQALWDRFLALQHEAYEDADPADFLSGTLDSKAVFAIVAEERAKERETLAADLQKMADTYTGNGDAIEALGSSAGLIRTGAIQECIAELRRGEKRMGDASIPTGLPRPHPLPEAVYVLGWNDNINCTESALRALLKKETQ